MRQFRTGLVAGVAFLLVGCVTAPIAEPVDYYAGIARQLSEKPPLLIVSGCSLRDEVGDDYFLVEAAQKRSADMSDALVKYLANYGLPPKAAPTTMMCAGYEPGEAESLRFIPSKDRESELEEGRFPKIFTPGAVTNVQDAETLHVLFKEVYHMPSSMITKDGDTPPVVSLDLSPEKIQDLRQHFGADYLWLVAGDSLEVSGGKVVGTAVLTAVLTLGTVASVPTGGASNMAALVDLREGKILWKKFQGGLGGVASATTTYSGSSTPTTMYTPSSVAPAPSSAVSGWAQNLLAPLLAPGVGLAGQSLGSMPAAPTAVAQP